MRITGRQNRQSKIIAIQSIVTVLLFVLCLIAVLWIFIVLLRLVLI